MVIEWIASVALTYPREKKSAIFAFVTFDVKAAIQNNHTPSFLHPWNKNKPGPSLHTQGATLNINKQKNAQANVVWGN